MIERSNPLYLFKLSESITNKMKVILPLIKEMNGSLKNFAYIHFDSTLLNHLSFMENLFIDAVNLNIHTTNTDFFEDYIKGLKNPYLKELITTSDIDSSVIGQLDTLKKLKLSLVKGLMSESESLFFDLSEHIDLLIQLPSHEIQLIKKAIIQEVDNGKKIIIIAKEESLWLDIYQHLIIYKDDKYSIKPNNYQLNKERGDNNKSAPVLKLVS